MTSSNQSEDELLVFARRVLVATLVVVSVLPLLLLIWYAADLLMLVFAAVLISILPRSVSEFLVQKTRLSHGLALAIVAIGLIALIMGASWLVTGRIAAQMRQLQLLLPEAVQNVKNYIGQYEWGRNAIDSLPSLNEWIARRGGTVISQLTGLASTTVGVVINILIVFISGLLFSVTARCDRSNQGRGAD
jgi:predicted PurR-regulated permease PerM